MSTTFNHIISLVGMSGIGKTTFAMSQNPGKYFHYSVDYVIGEFLLKNEIINDLTSKLGKNEVFEVLLEKNKVNIHTNLQVKDLSLVSNFLGKFGDINLGGIAKEEFLRRQKLYSEAEKVAILMLDRIADKIFACGYECIINDLTGSICEIIDFEDKNDEIMKFLHKTTIKPFVAKENHIIELIKRAEENPKPLLYNERFFEKELTNFRNSNQVAETEINPDEFCRYIFPKLINNRIDKYSKINALTPSRKVI